MGTSFVLPYPETAGMVHTRVTSFWLRVRSRVDDFSRFEKPQPVILVTGCFFVRIQQPVDAQVRYYFNKVSSITIGICALMLCGVLAAI